MTSMMNIVTNILSYFPTSLNMPVAQLLAEAEVRGPTMQPVYFEQSNELVINHFDDKSDYLVVIDVLEGKILSKVNLRTPMANGMFLTPGFNNDVLYCSTLAISKVSW